MIEKIEELNKIIDKCNMCRLSKIRKNVVYGTGGNTCDIMIISESPNAEEEIKKEAMFGNTGILLESALQTIGIRKDNVYCTNLVKCRTYANMKPQADEVNCCLNYLRNEVLVIKPKVIVLLGDIVSKSILGKEIENTNNDKIKVINKKNIKYIITYNLMNVLQNENKKVEFLNDLKLINEETK